MTEYISRVHQVTNLAKLAGRGYLSGIVARIWVWKHVYKPRVKNTLRRALNF